MREYTRARKVIQQKRLRMHPKFTWLSCGRWSTMVDLKTIFWADACSGKKRQQKVHMYCKNIHIQVNDNQCLDYYDKETTSQLLIVVTAKRVMAKQKEDDMLILHIWARLWPSSLFSLALAHHTMHITHDYVGSGSQDSPN